MVSAIPKESRGGTGDDGDDDADSAEGPEQAAISDMTLSCP